MEKEKEQKQEQEKEVKLQDKIKELVEKELQRLSESGIQVNNIDYYGKLIDIHKDIENEDYWKVKKEVYEMRYNDYDDRYSDGGYSEGRGRYSEGYGNYGRRGRGRNARRARCSSSGQSEGLGQGKTGLSSGGFEETIYTRQSQLYAEKFRLFGYFPLYRTFGR